MASREQGFMAGFMAASRILTTNGGGEQPAGKPQGGIVVPTPRQQARALERYLAIPTFIRQGRTVKR